MYECSICLSLNHERRLHCQNCGSVPLRYSFNGTVHNEAGLPVAVAAGAERSGSQKTSRSSLKTVAFDYYADETE